MARTITLADDNSELSGLLQSYIQSGSINFLIGSGASMPAISTAGKIEAEINKLIEDGDEAAANLRALTFIEDLAKKHASLVGGPENPNVTATTAGYTDFVTAIDRILFERKNLLLPRQANVFTTNYDMFVEYAASKLPSLILNDGFIRAATPSSDFPFAPERYFDRTYRSGTIYSHPSEMPTINLVKLHGSLSWRKKGESIVYDPGSIPPLADADRGDPAKVMEHIQQYFLILPNLRKFHWATMDRIYYDLLRLFANSMDRENAILMCFGFSFEDEHILDITRRALRNPTAQLLIFSHESDGAKAFEEKFSAQRNATVISPADGEKIDFAKLNNLLRASLPA